MVQQRQALQGKRIFKISLELSTPPNRFDKINKMRDFGEEGHQVTSVSVWEGNKNIGDQLSKIFIFLTISVSII